MPVSQPPDRLKTMRRSCPTASLPARPTTSLLAALLVSAAGCHQANGPSGGTALTPVSPLAPHGPSAAAGPRLGPFGGSTRVAPPGTGSYGTANNYLGGVAPVNATSQNFDANAASGYVAAAPGSQVQPVGWAETQSVAPSFTGGNSLASGNAGGMLPRLDGMPVNDFTRAPAPPGYPNRQPSSPATRGASTPSPTTLFPTTLFPTTLAPTTLAPTWPQPNGAPTERAHPKPRPASSVSRAARLTPRPASIPPTHLVSHRRRNSGRQRRLPNCNRCPPRDSNRSPRNFERRPSRSRRPNRPAKPTRDDPRTLVVPMQICRGVPPRPATDRRLVPTRKHPVPGPRPSPIRAPSHRRKRSNGIGGADPIGRRRPASSPRLRSRHW